MPTFKFAITHDVTMTAQVEIEADSIEDAREKALLPSFYRDPSNARFELDEGNAIRNVYLPDEDDWEQVDAPSVPGV